MKTWKTCPCGIAEVDCDYHKPPKIDPDTWWRAGIQREMECLLRVVEQAHAKASSFFLTDEEIEAAECARSVPNTDTLEQPGEPGERQIPR